MFDSLECDIGGARILCAVTDISCIRRGKICLGVFISLHKASNREVVNEVHSCREAAQAPTPSERSPAALDLGWFLCAS